MSNTRRISDLSKTLFPTRAIAVLMAIGFLDLVVTAWLHSRGLIVELNPVMKVFIERSEWLFATIKGLTLIAGWFAMVVYARVNLDFVRKASLIGASVYLATWTLWFFAGRA